MLGLSQLRFEHRQLYFCAVLKNSAYYAQNYAFKIKVGCFVRVYQPLY